MPFDKQQPPYRMPCDQVAKALPTVFFGSEFQHKDKNATASIFLNTTTVPNPIASGSLAPYERWTIDPSPGVTCQVHPCTSSAPCIPWEKPIIANTFTASLDASGSHVTESFSTCHKTHFKNLMAKKLWQGAWPFNAKEPSNGPDTITGCGDDTKVSYRSFISQSVRTKYLTLALDVTWTYEDLEDSSNNRAESIGVTQTINSGSGLPSYSGFSATDETSNVLGYLGTAFDSWSNVCSHMTNPTLPPETGNVTVYSTSGCSVSGGTDNVHDEEFLSWDLSAGTFSREIQIVTILLPGRFTRTQENFTVTDTGFEYDLVITGYFPYDLFHDNFFAVNITTVHVTATYSNAYTNSDVYGQIKNMLGTVDLTDDVLYPFRQDSKSNIAPMVARDEQANNNFTTNFFVADYGNPLPNNDFDPTTYPDIGWTGRTGITLAQDQSTGTTTIALDFPSTTTGTVIDSNVGIPFGYAISNSGSLSYSIIGGAFPDGVTFDSSTGHYSGTVSSDGHWGVTIEISCGTPAFTGALIPALYPAGYHYPFNFLYTDIKGCCDRDFVGDVSWEWYQQGYGMSVETFNSAAGVQLPKNCNNWNNYWEAINKPDGAWIFYADQGNYFPNGCISSTGISGVNDSLYLVACKYAVIMDDWPSQNFQRPARRDKFMYDETANHVFQLSGSCESLGSITGSGEGSQWGLLDLTNHNPVDDSIDFSGIWGGASVDGFYNVSYGSGVLTLGTKIYDVPSDWSSASGDEAFCFGKLRYPDAPSLLGREAVTSLATSSHQTVLTWAIPQTCFGLLTSSYQETVDFYDTKMTLLSSSIVVTRLDDNSFVSPLSSSFLKDGHTYYVTIHGASGSWYMNDATPKGDFLMLEWLADMRSQREFGRISGSIFDCGGSQVSYPTTNAGGGDVNNLFADFKQSASCLPVSPCSPKVICISPNGETFANGHTFPFPEDFVMDETYGSKWWRLPQTVMSDLLWQQPHRKACIGICAPWKDDNFACQSDVVTPCPGDEDYTGEEPPPEYFFASAPQVEARITVPCNYGNNQNECAPNVPSDVQIGWLSPVFHAYGSGSVALPPAPAGVAQGGGVPNAANLASAMHGAICGAMGGGCRFQYQVPGC